MNRSAIELMQQLLHCGTHIPLWHYDAQGHLLETNAEHLVLDKILGFIGGKDYMLSYGKKGRKPLMLTSELGLMWGAVFETDRETLKSIYLMGPVYHAEVSASFLEETADRYCIDPVFRRQYISIMGSLCVVPGMMFQQYCLMLHYCVTGQQLNRSDIQFQPRSKSLTPMTDQEQSFDRSQTYRAEQTLLQMIREGDINYRQAISRAPHLFDAMHPRHRESLTSAIISSTGFAALCIREAIRAGISTDTAFSVGDGYIEAMTQCKSVSELTSLNLAMFEDLIFRVRKNRTDPRVSAQIRSCRDYIELHAEQELKLGDLAKQVGYSPYYLSRKFKEEMGMSISTYIKYVRVERSKLMLVSTGLTVAQIAETLHFASSSHFSDVFGNVVGKTPQQYRNENQRY